MLPENYRKLEYIENDEVGSYIDTGLIASYEMRVVLEGDVIDGDTALFGARTSMYSNDAFALQFTSENYYRFTFNNLKYAAPASYGKGIKRAFDVSKDGFFIDGDLISTPTARTLRGNFPIFMVGAMNTNGEAASFGLTRLYSAKVYVGENLVRDYIPCISELGEYGLYDEVEGAFYGNAGEGSFNGEPEPFCEIRIVSLPAKQVYEKGQEFEPDGMVVEAYCTNGYHEEITDYEISGFDSENVGIQMVTVTYEGLSDEFPVIVNDVPSSELIVSLEEMKQYLRVDFEDDDVLIEELIKSSERHCMDIARKDDMQEFRKIENAKVAVMYTVACQYENRQSLNNADLNLSLRALLFGSREEVF